MAIFINKGHGKSRGNNNQSPGQTPAKFEGRTEALKGFIFDYGIRMPLNYSSAIKELVIYAGKTYGLYCQKSIQDRKLATAMIEKPQALSQDASKLTQFDTLMYTYHGCCGPNISSTAKAGGRRQSSCKITCPPCF